MDGLLKYLAEFGAPRSEETISKLATGNPLMLAKAARNRAEVRRAQISDLMNYPQDWSQFGQNLSQAYPTSSPEAVRQAAYQAAVNAGPLMTVWQGSPHKFAPTKNNPLGEFDASKIGSGEGAQAYGYGHYLAESPSVAKSYQGKVSAMHKAQGKQAGEVTIGGKPINWEDPQQVAAFELARHNGDRLAAAEFHARTFAGGENNPAVKLLRSQSELPKVDLPGHLYKVDLPDEHIGKMLDWDKPLSQQAPEVQTFFAPYVEKMRKIEGGRSGAEWGDLAAPRTYDPTGNELLRLISKSDRMTAQSVLNGGLGPEISEKLRAAGIPGIRYLDGGSRAGGQGTSNFVVFPGNESILKILGRE